jgi:hypothetical protein
MIRGPLSSGLTSGLLTRISKRSDQRSDLIVSLCDSPIFRFQPRSDLRSDTQKGQLDLGLTSVWHWSDLRFDLLASLCDHGYLANSADLEANLHNSVCYEQFLSEGFG